MQNIKQIIANISENRIHFMAIICSFLMVSILNIYRALQPSLFKLFFLISGFILVLFIINGFRLNYILKNILKQNYKIHTTLKENCILSLYSLSYPVLAAVVIGIELILCALIKTDLLYFTILAIFTGIFFIMFLLTFISGLELEYIKSNFSIKKLFSFNEFINQNSSDIIARYTAITVIELLVIGCGIKIIELFKLEIVLQFVLTFIILLIVLYFIISLEKYKLNLKQ